MSLIHDTITAETLKARMRRYYLSGETTEDEFAYLATFVNDVTPRLVDVEAYTHPVDEDFGTKSARAFFLSSCRHYQIDNIALAAMIVRDTLAVHPRTAEERAACAALEALFSEG